MQSEYSIQKDKDSSSVGRLDTLRVRASVSLPMASATESLLTLSNVREVEEIPNGSPYLGSDEETSYSTVGIFFCDEECLTPPRGTLGESRWRKSAKNEGA